MHLAQQRYNKHGTEARSPRVPLIHLQVCSYQSLSHILQVYMMHLHDDGAVLSAQCALDRGAGGLLRGRYGRLHMHCRKGVDIGVWDISSTQRALETACQDMN